MIRRCCVAVLLCSFLAFNAADAQESGFRPIFDGESLQGWSGDESFWQVKNSAIVAESTPENPCKKNTFLVWKDGRLDDFELKLKFKISGSESANSGIQFRSQIAEDGHVVGYQADIDLAGQWLGACYDEHGRGTLAKRGEKIVMTAEGRQVQSPAGQPSAEEVLESVKPGEWNTYHIIARGNEITLKLNDLVSTTFVDNNKQERDFSGVLALQLHSGPPMKVEFKDIHLKRLPLTDGRKKVVFVAGTRSHGYFSHEHNAGCLLLAKALEESGLPVETAVYTNGWPSDSTAFDNADTIVSYCDGGGRHYLNPRLEEFDALMNKGVGLACLHYGVEVPKGPSGEHFLKWIGGYFEPYWSVNPHWDANFTQLPDHPITNGVKPFEIRDEWYYHMRFRENMEGVTPILTDLPPRETLNRKDGSHSGNPHVRAAVLERKEPQHVAWAYDRPDGGRGFGFTGGHFHKNWQDDNFRKVVLNAILWTAGGDVPEDGIPSETPTQEELEANQDFPKPGTKTENKPRKPSPLKVANNQKAAFQSDVVTVNTARHVVDIEADIKGAKSLYLVVTDGGNGFSCDWADWIEPTLIGPDKSLKLTDMKWASASTDYGQVRVDRNAGNQPLNVGGRSPEFGIGTHANSIIEYKLPEDQTFTTFKAKGGLDVGGTGQGACGEQTSVQFLVYVNQLGPAAIVNRPTSSGNQSRELDDALDQLETPDDLEATLFAGEPVLANPTNIDIDHLGRVWVAEVVNYRKFRNKETEARAEGDRILILEDTNHDGKADKTIVFYQSPDIDSAHGLCVLGNKAIVSAGANVFILTDEDGDWKADKRETLFTGIDGVQHDHGIHAFVFGPDGKLYFNFGNAGKRIKDKNGQPIVDKAGNTVDDSRQPYQEGMVFRCNLDGSEFETLGWNFRNNWEVAIDSFGTLWQSDNDDDGNRGVRINYVMEYGNYGYRDELTGAGWRDPRTGWSEEIPKRHWHLNDPGVVPNLLQTGAGSPTGICVYEGDLLPKRFQGEILHCDAGPNIVRGYQVTPDGAGYTAEIHNILEGTQDKWFRPSDVGVAADGSIFIADWYDPGVGGHRMGDVERGRIFRVAPPGHKYAPPKFDFSTVQGALNAIANPNSSVRYLAFTALQAMGDQAETALVAAMQSEQNPRVKARILWLLSKVPARGAQYVMKAINSDDPMLQVVAIRAARQHTEPERYLPQFKQLAKSNSAAVRREIAIAASELPTESKADLWVLLANQHDGEDRWYLEALGVAARGNWEECLDAWYHQQDGEIENTKANRDIIWRSRCSNTPAMLADLIADPETPTTELPRLFRAYDFVSGGDKNELLARLAFLINVTNPERGSFITAEALKRLQEFDINSRPEFKEAINKVLSGTKGSPSFIATVDKFQLKDRYPELVDVVVENFDQQLGVDAARVLLKRNQQLLLRNAIKTATEIDAGKIITALGLSGETKRIGVLLPLVKDELTRTQVRRDAVKALGKDRQGLLQVMKLAQSGDLDPKLKQVVAATLHGQIYKDIKDVANELYPLPPSKDETPLPAVSELAKLRGDARKGGKLYHSTATCAKCHQVGPLGKEVGPNLTEIGSKLSREAMYESILYPSAGISHNYESYLVITDDGKSGSGLLISESDSEVILKNAEGISITFDKDSIIEMEKQDVSLMPADLQKVMTKEELVDVVEYLMTLKKK